MTSLLDYLDLNNHDPGGGEQLRDSALGRIRTHRRALVARLMRAFLRHLLDHGPATSDALRDLVEIPVGIDPRCVGAAVRSLPEFGLTKSVGTKRSRRPKAHSRKLEIWAVCDRQQAEAWLIANPEPESAPEPATDPDDPFAI